MDEIAELKQKLRTACELLEQAVKGNYGLWTHWVSKTKEFLKGAK